MSTSSIDIMSNGVQIAILFTNNIYISRVPLCVIKCSKPVLAAVRGGCIGIGLELISAADMRFASEDSWFAARVLTLFYSYS